MVKRVKVQLTWPENGYVNLYTKEVKRERKIRQRIGWRIVQIGLVVMMGFREFDWYINCDKDNENANAADDLCVR